MADNDVVQEDRTGKVPRLVQLAGWLSLKLFGGWKKRIPALAQVKLALAVRCLPLKSACPVLVSLARTRTDSGWQHVLARRVRKALGGWKEQILQKLTGRGPAKRRGRPRGPNYRPIIPTPDAVRVTLHLPLRFWGRTRFMPVFLCLVPWAPGGGKLSTAASLVRKLIAHLGGRNWTVVLCDNELARPAITRLHTQARCALVCRLRTNHSLSVLPGADSGEEQAGKLRPRDFALAPVPGTRSLAGARAVSLPLFGERSVLAMVRQVEDGDRQLFVCTDPAPCRVFGEEPALLAKAGRRGNASGDEAVRLAEAGQDLVPLAMYVRYLGG